MSNSTGWKPEKGWLGKLEGSIPKSKNGDPAFTLLGVEELDEENVRAAGGVWFDTPGSVLSVFSPEQVVHLVNQQLYSLLYQRESHRKRAAAEQEALGPLKAKVKELFGVSYLKATEEQLREAMNVLAKPEGK